MTSRPVVTVIDYGMGNLFSVARAFEDRGAQVVVTDSPQAIESAERLVLPGVGAFADGMMGLRECGLIESIQTYAKSGRPFLGICLGMQMMLEVGEEFGEWPGLGLIPGRVVAIPPTDAEGNIHKIPHIGWNELTLPPNRKSWDHTILEGIMPGASTYFVHSFTAMPADENHRLADCFYNDRRISAAIQSGSLYGCQFHPEKSGSVGLRIINNFVMMNHGHI